jgi:hypothetical protein
MSLAEIKETIAKMSPDERLEMSAFIAHLSQSDDPEYQTEMDKRMSAMDAGRKVSAESMGKLHLSLLEQGK